MSAIYEADGIAASIPALQNIKVRNVNVRDIQSHLQTRILLVTIKLNLNRKEIMINEL